MIIAVGSTNPVKINAVKTACEQKLHNLRLLSTEVESGIPAQPRGDGETRTGAQNRARAVSKQFPQAELSIGLEGGVYDVDGKLWSVVWCCVVDLEQNLYESSGARFSIPTIIAKPMMRGEEMGPALDHLLQEKDIRKKHGMIGTVTKNFVTRTEEYASIVKIAVGLWYGKDWVRKIHKK